MTRARVVDTSVLLAAVSPSEPQHAQARRWLSEAGPAVVPNEVLIETLGVLRKRHGRGAASAFLHALRTTRGIELGHESSLPRALALLDRQPALSLADAVGIDLAVRLGCALDTFDETQRKAWRSASQRG